MDPRRLLVGYAEFLREAGNLYVEASPEQRAMLESLRPAAAAKPAAKVSPPPPPRAAAPPPPRSATPQSAPSRPAAPPPAAARTADLVHIARSAGAFDGPPLAREERQAKIDEARKIVEACRKCERLKGRTQSVYSSGDIMSKIVFIGEAPGAEEDKTGIPFVGRAGQLLTKMIEAIGFARDEVYICNTLKCRPPDNAPPLPAEKKNCEPFLLQQLDWIRPQIIVALGAHAAGYMTGQEGSLGQMRKQWHSFRGIPVMVTYHPSFLLRSPGFKPQAWDDMKKLHARYCELNPGEERKIWKGGGG